jgi:hypothetical protein
LLIGHLIGVEKPQSRIDPDDIFHEFRGGATKKKEGKSIFFPVAKKTVGWKPLLRWYFPFDIVDREKGLGKESVI